MNYIQQSANFRGLEGKAVYDLWHSEDGVAATDQPGRLCARHLVGRRECAAHSAWRAGGGLNWEGESFDAGFQVIRVGDQNSPGLFDTPTPGYVELNAQIAWRPTHGHRDRADRHNLADQVQRNAASLNKNLVIAPGRNIRLARYTDGYAALMERALRQIERAPDHR